MNVGLGCIVDHKDIAYALSMPLYTEMLCSQQIQVLSRVHVNGGL
jgi:hypothetical protein